MHDKCKIGIIDERLSQVSDNLGCKIHSMQFLKTQNMFARVKVCLYSLNNAAWNYYLQKVHFGLNVYYLNFEA